MLKGTWQMFGLGSEEELLAAEHGQVAAPAHPLHRRAKLKRHLHLG